MTVSELIELLEKLDDNVDVSILVSRENEYQSIKAVEFDEELNEAVITVE